MPCRWLPPWAGGPCGDGPPGPWAATAAIGAEVVESQGANPSVFRKCAGRTLRGGSDLHQRGRGPGPLGLKRSGAPRPRWAPPKPQMYAALAFCRVQVFPGKKPLWPHPVPHLRRGPFPCAGPGWAGPPAAASRARSGAFRPRAFSALSGPAPRAFPPAFPFGPCAPGPLPRLRGRSLRSRARGPALCPLRAPLRGVALAPFGCAPWACGPPPVPPWPVPFGASGAAGSRAGGVFGVPPPARFLCSGASLPALPVSGSVPLPVALCCPSASPQAPFPFPRPAGAGESPGPARGACGPPCRFAARLPRGLAAAFPPPFPFKLRVSASKCARQRLAQPVPSRKGSSERPGRPCGLPPPVLLALRAP